MVQQKPKPVDLGVVVAKGDRKLLLVDALQPTPARVGWKRQQLLLVEALHPASAQVGWKRQQLLQQKHRRTCWLHLTSRLWHLMSWLWLRLWRMELTAMNLNSLSDGDAQSSRLSPKASSWGAQRALTDTSAADSAAERTALHWSLASGRWC